MPFKGPTLLLFRKLHDSFDVFGFGFDVLAFGEGPQDCNLQCLQGWGLVGGWGGGVKQLGVI